MANPIVAMFKDGGNWDMKKVLFFVVAIIVLSWAFSKLFGRNNYTVTESNKEKLEIITTDNAIPNTPVSKVPLKALGVLAQNNHRRYLPGFDLEGSDAPS